MNLLYHFPFLNYLNEFFKPSLCSRIRISCASSLLNSLSNLIWKMLLELISQRHPEEGQAIYRHCERSEAISGDTTNITLGLLRLPRALHALAMTLCVGFLLFLSISIAHASDEPSTKIAVVDVESILENSLAISGIREDMNALGVSIQKEITDKEKEFKTYEEQLLAKQNTLNKEKFDDLVAKFQQDVSDTQKKIQIKKLALEQAHSEAIEMVHKTTISIISELAKERGYNVVLPSNQILFVTNDLNITLEVITHLNERLKKVPINYEKFMN